MYSHEFETKLISDRYRKIDSGDGGIHAYICDSGGIRRIIGVINRTDSYKFTGEYLNVVRSSLVARYNAQALLYVIFTDNSYETRMRVSGNYNHWIYNEADDRLEIYDDQPDDFFNIDKILESSNEHTYSRVFNITNLIILLNVAVYVGLYMYSKGTVRYNYYEYGAPSAYAVFEQGQYFRIIAGMFMHSGIQHLVGNMIMLYFIGSRLEQVMGVPRYSITYFAGGIIAGLTALIYYGMHGGAYINCIGASGAIFAVIGAMVYVLIINKGKVQDMSLKGMIIYIVISIVYGMTTEGISLSAHIGGLIAGFVIAAIIYPGRKKG